MSPRPEVVRVALPASLTPLLPPLPLPLLSIGMRSSPPPMTFAGPETTRYGTVSLKLHRPVCSFPVNGRYNSCVLSVPPYLPVVNSAPAPTLTCAHAQDAPTEMKTAIHSLLNRICREPPPDNSIANCDGPIGCFCSFGLSLRDWKVRTTPISHGAQPNEHSQECPTDARPSTIAASLGAPKALSDGF